MCNPLKKTIKTISGVSFFCKAQSELNSIFYLLVHILKVKISQDFLATYYYDVNGPPLPQNLIHSSPPNMPQNFTNHNDLVNQVGDSKY